MIYLKCIPAILAVIVCAAAIGPPSGDGSPEKSFQYIQSQTHIFVSTVHTLKLSIDGIDSSKWQTIQPVIKALRAARLQYKKISFFLDYFYPQQGRLFNGPAKKEVEEPFLEYEEPQSFQQIESILFGPDPQQKKADLENLVLVLDESAEGLSSLYAGFQLTEDRILESLHLELIRIMTLYITGYDAPDLKSGIQESREALESIHFMTRLFFPPENQETILLDSLLVGAIRYTATSDFDHFNRLAFITRYLLPAEEYLQKCIVSSQRELTSVTTLDFHSKNLFQGEIRTLNKIPNPEMIRLGRKLYFETALSGNNMRSCASCHQPGRYFTDQLIVNRKIKTPAPLSRNTPTLLYASFQNAQFWDGHAASLSEQIGDVLISPDEMNASLPEIERRLLHKDAYRALWKDSVTWLPIEEAIAAYLQTLQPLNSPFDQYMSGNLRALNSHQKNGFNLFMGKARCGTCHFAPVFNGSTPPFFNRTEYEVLGVPARTASAKKIADTDMGRYKLFPISLYRRAFKTPTIRNIAKTGPYMHNGSFKSLRSVLDFYNLGGGAGIGLGNPEQTLSEKPLHLSDHEISDLIAFMGALTDDLTGY